jgi:hypothetical protein
MPDVLIVFNHPLWDQQGLGRNAFLPKLDRFLKAFNPCFHAFELNAMRGWAENKSALQLAAPWDRPIISGGDRHGCEPSGALNLSNATSFAEFVREVREDRLSHILLMPQYAEPLGIRFMQTVVDTIRHYPDHPVGSRHWDERVFHVDCGTGYYRPLAALWKSPPAFLGKIFSVIRMMEHASVRQALTFTFGGKAELQQTAEASHEVIA